MGPAGAVLCLRQVQIGSECSININRNAGCRWGREKSVCHGTDGAAKVERGISVGIYRASASWCPGCFETAGRNGGERRSSWAFQIAAQASTTSWPLKGKSAVIDNLKGWRWRGEDQVARKKSTKDSRMRLRTQGTLRPGCDYSWDQPALGEELVLPLLQGEPETCAFTCSSIRSGAFASTLGESCRIYGLHPWSIRY